MSELVDGTYDVMVVDVACDEKDGMRVDVVITSGPAKGTVASLRTRARDDGGVSLLGENGVLQVVDGAPSLAFG